MSLNIWMNCVLSYICQNNWTNKTAQFVKQVLDPIKESSRRLHIWHETRPNISNAFTNSV